MEVVVDVLLEEQTYVERVASELAVRGGPLLELPEGRHPLVRLPEEAEPEHGDGDDQQGSPHEGDEQLGVDPGRHAADRPDDGIVGRAQQTPLARLCRSLDVRGRVTFGHGLRGSIPRSLRPSW